MGAFEESEHEREHSERVRLLGNRLREIRLQRGASQERVAHDAGLTLNTYANLERGCPANGRRINPTLDTLFRVLQALDMEIDDLIRVHATAEEPRGTGPL